MNFALWSRGAARRWLWLPGMILLHALLTGCGGDAGRKDYETAMQEVRKGRWVYAKATLEKSISRYPGSALNARANNLLGMACWNLGEKDKALEAFETSRRIDPLLPDPAINLGIVLMESGDLGKAELQFREAAQMNTEDVRPQEYLGQLYLRRGDFAQAKQILTEALKKSSSPRILTSLGVAELRVSGPGPALACMMQALETDERYLPALFNIGVISQYWRGDQREAESYYKQYLREAPEGDHAREARQYLRIVLTTPSLGTNMFLAAPPVPPPPPGIAPTGMAVMAAATSTPAVTPEEEIPSAAPAPAPVVAPVRAGPLNARDLYQAALAQSRGEDSARELAPFLRAAAEAKKDGLRALRGEILINAVNRYPNEAEAHYQLAQYYVDENRNADAIYSLKKATTLRPDWPAAQCLIGRLAMDEKQDETAQAALNEAVRLDPRNADALWTLAQLYSERLRLADKARGAYSSFVERFPLDPRRPQASEWLSRSASKMITPAPTSLPPAPRVGVPVTPPVKVLPAGPVVEVSETQPGTDEHLNLQKPRTRDELGARNAFRRGKMAQDEKKWQDAIRYYRQSLEKDDGNVEAWYNLGVAYARKGLSTPAIEAFAEALRHRPEMDNARYNIAVLYHQRNQDQAALRQLELILDRTPKHPQAHFLMGEIYGANPISKDTARRHFTEFLRLAPNDSNAPKAQKWLQTH